MYAGVGDRGDSNFTSEDEPAWCIGFGSAEGCVGAGGDTVRSSGEDGRAQETELHERLRAGAGGVEDDIHVPRVRGGHDALRVRFASREIGALTLIPTSGVVYSFGVSALRAGSAILPASPAPAPEPNVLSASTWACTSITTCSSSHSGIEHSTCIGSAVHVHRISYNILSDTRSLSPARSSSSSSSSSSNG
jgi:hypothetical protein